MKDFLNDLDSMDKIILTISSLAAIVVITTVVLVRLTTSLDLYLLKDNPGAIELYLSKKQ